MSTKTIKLIVSDLHVASGDKMLDGFGERQQAALEGLLAAAGRNGGSALGEADDVELIILLFAIAIVCCLIGTVTVRYIRGVKS